ncbi:MAG: cation:proton antiporter [Gammaproteobacteria bacterium]|jgi:Kef-type K+ transport system membrane component KefB|nr:cation:proton antiporter [Gammaproteobacteria bacterium]
MHADTFIQTLFLIFTGAALIATVALFLRQALPVAYILLGMIIGPWGLGLTADAAVVDGMAEIGIIFLLFLLGLNLEPRELLQMLREAVAITAVTCIAFAAAGIAIGLLFGLDWLQALLVGLAMMFSSTIIGLKLLPTSSLHHQRMGEIIIAVLLLQDIIAIALILFIQGSADSANPMLDVGLLLLSAPLLFLLSFVIARYALMPLMQRFDRIQEYVFLLTIGWCLAIAYIGHLIGLSYEIAAFLAGVSIATNPVSRFIAETLKPLRDFFLIIFFVALGAGFNMGILPQIALPAATLAVTMLVLKPLVFGWALSRHRERPPVAREIGLRLGQVSEFSLLLALVGLQSGMMTEEASYIIQAATIFTFMVSSYVIVMRVPTPVATNEALRRD